MLTLFLLGVLAGLDNLQAAAALAIAPLARGRRVAFAAAFVVCETLTPIAGVLIAHGLRAPLGHVFDRIAPIVVAGCGIALLLRDELPRFDTRWMVITLPLSLSLDNLLIGVSAGTLPHPPLLAALAIGATSALMCLAGIAGGTRIGRLVPRHGDAVSGVALLVVAASMWIRG